MPTFSKEYCADTLPVEATVKVAIKYCEVGNYSKAARDLDRAIRAEFAGSFVEVERIPSSGGVYEVSVNGKLIYSKKATHRLPGDDEIFYHVRASLPSRPHPNNRGLYPNNRGPYPNNRPRLEKTSCLLFSPTRG